MKRILLMFLLVTGVGIGAESGVSEAEADSCIDCHGNRERMASAGHARLAVTAEDVRSQAKMDISCTACHLGNPSEATKEGAHKNLLRLYVVKNKQLEATTRDKLAAFAPGSLEPRGKNALIELLPQIEKNGKLVKDPDVQVLLYHDKNPADLSFNYPVLEKTCGACHAKQVEGLKQSAMGHNTKQRMYRTWTDEKMGPHNCGVWFAEGFEDIAANTTRTFTKEMSAVNQKACNSCHVGCLDCHYTPRTPDPGHPELGSHTFSKAVSAVTCYGGGRGSICHAGPEDRRRGAGFIGGPFANPAGAAPDIHFSKGLQCTDCHETTAQDKRLLHGQVRRQVNCGRCHAQVVVHAGSIHRKVSCEACHIRDVGAYTATFWGPGVVAGVRTPFMKYKEYYGVMKEPVLIKDQRGIWIPVKPYPMAVLNQKSSGKLKQGLAWRFPAHLPDLERTDDAYAFVGLLKGLPENDKALAWIQMDKMSHKYGPARPCQSCHREGGVQRQEVLWKYNDQGAEPFEGKQVVTADKRGLSITGMQATTPIKPREGWKIEDFAPWYYLKDAWKVKGDFSLPSVRKKNLYDRERSRYEALEKTGGRYHE